MCEPTTIAAASLALGAIGTGVTIMGQQQAASAQSAQANYQAAVARNNAVLSQRAADDVRQRGEIAQRDAAVKSNQLLGRQRAVFASNGVDVNSGSALDIQGDTAADSSLDQLTVRSNAERQAQGFEAQGMNYNSQANLDLFAGTNAEAAGDSASIGSALAGAGSVASKWYDFNKAGVFSGGSSGGTYAPSAAFYAQ